MLTSEIEISISNKRDIENFKNNSLNLIKTNFLRTCGAK